MPREATGATGATAVGTSATRTTPITVARPIDTLWQQAVGVRQTTPFWWCSQTKLQVPDKRFGIKKSTFLVCYLWMDRQMDCRRAREGRNIG